MFTRKTETAHKYNENIIKKMLKQETPVTEKTVSNITIIALQTRKKLIFSFHKIWEFFGLLKLKYLLKRLKCFNHFSP